MDLGLRGRRAIVTGGSKGLGKAIAAELLAEGAAVAICSRHKAELDETAAELAASGGSVTALPCDVTDPGQVESFIAAAAAALGGTDILVNNAGAARPGQFAALTDEDWHDDIEVKLFSQNPLHPRSAAAPAPEHRAARHQHQRRIRSVPGPGFPRLVGEPRVLPELVQGPVHRARPRGDPGQQREHRLRRDTAVGEHPRPPGPRSARPTSSSGSSPPARYRSAGSAGPTRSRAS